MNAQAKISASTTEPEVLRFVRGLDDYNRHRLLQLIIREFAYAEREADLFLSAAASELHPNREDLQDALYPMGRLNMEASRLHRIELEGHMLRAERRDAGRSAMLCARLDAIADRRASL